jgi:putative lipoic acid-binding regulatory protein
MPLPSNAESPLKFPCRFPIKVMGRHEADFEAQVLAMISEHVGVIPPENVRSRESSQGRFLSVTVTITAESREQLDNVYRTLTASERVLFVL